MGRLLNISELDWLKGEVARLQKETSGGGDKTARLQTLLNELYSLHVQMEGFDPNNPTVQAVQRELGLI